MKRLSFTVPMVLVAIHLPGCGSGNDDAGLNLNATQGPGPAATAEVEMTKEQLLEDNLTDMIFLLEQRDIPIFFERYVELDLVRKVEVHNATFPERKSLQTMYDDFDQGVRAELLADLKACQAMTPQFELEQEGWYSAYYYDEKTMSAEVVLGYHPEFDRTWDVLELPLTLPWGSPQSEHPQWLAWEAAIETPGPRDSSGRDWYVEAFDPHQSPAAVIASSQIYFKGRSRTSRLVLELAQDNSKQKAAIQSYIKLLTPDAQRVEACLAARRLLVHNKAAGHISKIHSHLDRFQFDRTGLEKGFTFKNETDIPFYLQLAERFGDQADLAAFVAESAVLYRELFSDQFPLFHPLHTGKVIHIDEVDGALEFDVTWAALLGQDSFTQPTRFYQIDGKWYIESSWQARARER